MPELPEVEVTRQGIEPFVCGYRIDKIICRPKTLRWPIPLKQLQSELQGQFVQSIKRRGKYLLFEMPSGFFVLHLGMSGFLRILPEFVPPQKHDHVDFLFDSGRVLRFNDTRRFGALLWLGEQPFSHSLLAHLGIEPLEPEFNGQYLFQRALKKKTSVKTYLMDQKTVVGVGNIYANEALFKAKIHPLRPSASISLKEYQLLTKHIKLILKHAIKQGGTTLKDFSNADGKPGYFSQSLQVYGRADEPCLNCSTPIQNIRVGQRSTYFCGKCQKGD
tara:strand:+ start:24943 stop:25767 length:825 start_codon:yes stop_codon:yes gene_type:complete